MTTTTTLLLLTGSQVVTAVTKLLTQSVPHPPSSFTATHQPKLQVLAGAVFLRRQPPLLRRLSSIRKLSVLLHLKSILYYVWLWALSLSIAWFLFISSLPTPSPPSQNVTRYSLTNFSGFLFFFWRRFTASFFFHSYFLLVVVVVVEKGGNGLEKPIAIVSPYDEAMDALSSLITKRSRADKSNKGDRFDLLFDYLKVVLFDW